MAFLDDQKTVMQNFIESTKPLREEKYKQEILKEGTYAQRALDVMEKARLEKAQAENVANIHKDAYTESAKIHQGTEFMKMGAATPPEGSYLAKAQPILAESIKRQGEMGALEAEQAKKGMLATEKRAAEVKKREQAAKIAANSPKVEGPSFLRSFAETGRDFFGMINPFSPTPSVTGGINPAKSAGRYINKWEGAGDYLLERFKNYMSPTD